MNDVPVDPMKARKEAWAISGMKEKCGDEEEDLYRVFKPSEYSINATCITFNGLPEGDWTIIIVQMDHTGRARQSVVKTTSTGLLHYTILARPPEDDIPFPNA